MMQRNAAADYLDKMALAMELLGESQRDSETFRTAGSAIDSIDDGQWQAWLRHEAPAPGGFSPLVQASLLTVARMGSAVELEERLLRIPPGLFLLLQLPILNPALVRRLWIDGQIISIKQLERACVREKLAGLDGFDREMQKRLLLEIKRLRHTRSHWLRRTAQAAAAAREEQLGGVKGVLQYALAGQVRRSLETISEIVWVVAADSPQQVLGRIGTLAGANLPTAASPNTITFELIDRPRERIVVVEARAFAAHLFLETGAAVHTDAVLERLYRRGDGAELPETEAEIYQRAGLPLIDPVLREGRGEIEAAADGQLPDLLCADDIRGVLHVHTTWSDGKGSVFQMANKASQLGWRYIGISDHSEAAFYAHGLSADRIDKQREAISKAQVSLPDVKIFHGIESDILPDGRLDLGDQVLHELDFVVASVHSVLQMDRHEMTLRLIRAVEHPAVTLLGHPSGRLLLERESYSVDWDALFSAAAAAGTAIEFNAPDERLDLDWRLIRSATERGVKICVNPDAHTIEAMENVATGIAVARKGWLTRSQVLNCLDTNELTDYLGQQRAGRL